MLIFLKIFSGIQLIYSVVLLSVVQQSESVVRISTLFQILFPYRSLLSIEQSSFCYTVGLYYGIVYMSIPIPYSLPDGNNKIVFYTCDSISVA